MKSIQQLAKEIRVREWHGNRDFVPAGITLDSREAAPGMLFAALPGTQVDGHQFIDAALKNGAQAILCSKLPEKLHPDVCYCLVDDSSRALGLMADAFFDHPSRKLKLTGVTGTNGKTTIATVLHELFEQLGYPAGLISTIRVTMPGQNLGATHTTPDAISVNRSLANMVELGCSHAFMEVSSHALDQNRVHGMYFSGAVFTNLSRDHLDYHPDFASYLAAKKRLFDTLPKEAFALVNADDKNGQVMLQNCEAAASTFSIRSSADYQAKILEQHIQGTQLKIHNQDVWTRFVGKYNASNLLAVYATAMLLDQEAEQVLQVLSQVHPVEGRMETIDLGDQVTGIVDYAHTPDALQNVLRTLKDLRSKDMQIITLFGAGGDRDAGKRPQMAEVACRYSDRVIITSDNPRTEDPDQIIKDIEKGVPADMIRQTLSISNRREAIKTARALALPGDIILVAGKGHETYQEINGVKHHFDDREELERLTKDKQTNRL